MDEGFLTELGISLMERHATRNFAAMPTVFAYILVHQRKFDRLRHFAPFLPPAPLVRALAVINQNRYAFCVFKRLLGGFDVIRIMNFYHVRQFAGLVKAAILRD